MKTVANELTAYAKTNDLTWPYVYLPFFESFALRYFAQSHGEFIGLNTIVTHDQRESFINWTSSHYEEWIQESHMIKYGHLDNLDQNKSRYNPYISKLQGFSPADEDIFYSVRTAQSPPMNAYGPMMNLNLNTIPGNAALQDGLYALEYETLVTRIKPFNALPAEEHQGFHTDSEADNPHSFMYIAIHEEVNDPRSNIVASITSSVAWDASMQDLLPENVKGILCVVKNSCNQSFTYEIEGHSAYYLGDGDRHSSQYDDLEVSIDLSLHTHPDFTSTPGHCMYSMVSTFGCLYP